jgi:hypothetical protein
MKTVFRLMNSGSMSGSHFEDDGAFFRTGGLDDSSSMMIEVSELTEDNFFRLFCGRLGRFFSTKIIDSSLSERLKAFPGGESKMTESLSLSARLIVPFIWLLRARVLLEVMPARLTALNVPRQLKLFMFTTRPQIIQIKRLTHANQIFVDKTRTTRSFKFQQNPAVIPVAEHKAEHL